MTLNRCSNMSHFAGPATLPRVRAAAALTTVALTAVALTGAPMAAGAVDDRPLVVSTMSILDDMVRHIGGELVVAHSLTPIGDEVHEYELRPEDFVALEQADLVLLNGYGLEQWMDQVEATAPQTPLLAVAEASGWPILRIRVGERTGDPDPHLWMHPDAAMAYAAVIRDALIALRPNDAATLTAAAQAYAAEIERARDAAAALLAEVPEAQRLLVTSEAAFLYFAEAFGWRHEGIWGTNAEDEGTPAQLRRIVDLVLAERPAAIFFESTISDRHVRAIADDTATRVAGPLHVDSLGGPDSGAATYPALLVSNARTIRNALLEE